MKRPSRLKVNLLRSTLLCGLLCGLFSVAAASAEVASSAEDIQPLLVGSEVPDVTVGLLDGTKTSFHELIKQEPTVLIFYRGGW